MITVWCSLIFSIILLLIDQCSKLIVVHYMSVGDSISIIEGFFSFEYLQNKGAAFGMMQNFRYAFIVLTLAVIILALFAMFKGKFKNKYLIWSIALILSGGTGNLIDRIFNTGGYVVDFFKFEFSWFPYIFNFADICVTIGGAILVLYLIFDLISNHKTNKNIKPTTQTEEVSENE